MNINKLLVTCQYFPGFSPLALRTIFFTKTKYVTNEFHWSKTMYDKTDSFDGAKPLR